METTKHKIKAVIVQSNPEYKNIKANIDNLNEMISSYKKEDKIDLILFPEMALTGYFFDSKSDIEPYTSYCNSGITFDFCSSISKKLNCYTFIGYPEKDPNGNYYNSLMITNMNGELIKSYHKKNLYKDDKKWCTPGVDFEYIEIETHSGKTLKLALAICLDIYYASKENKFCFEYANFFCNKNIDLIIFATNYSDEYPEDNTENGIKKAIFKNWIEPLGPLCLEAKERNIYFLASDRTGMERDKTLLGCSCVIKLGFINKFIKFLNKKENGTILWEQDI